MPATKKRSKATHPPYAAMIKEAIVTLKERTGSSRPALRKFIAANYKLPDGWEKKLSLYLKKMTLEGALVQVKASWKLGEKLKKQPSTAKSKKTVTGTEKPKTTATAKSKRVVQKRKAATTEAEPKKRRPVAKKKVKKSAVGDGRKSRRAAAVKKMTPKMKKPVKKTPSAPKKRSSKAPATGMNKKRAAAAGKK